MWTDAGGDRPTVLYITGMMRSGSTLVGNILNEVDGVIHVGELHFLWKNLTRPTASNSSCGCGQPLADCEFWRMILAGAVDLGAADAVVAGQRSTTRVRHTLARLIDPAGPGAAAPVVRDRLAAYRAICAAGGASVVVDSSKVPVEPLVLAATGEIDLRVLHIVRSPLATMDSYRKPKGYIRSLSSSRALGYWIGFNLAAEAVAARSRVPYLRMTYEDVVGDPVQAIRRILDFAGVTAVAPIGTGGVVELGTNHTVTGNPDRFLRGSVTVAAPPAKSPTESVLRTALVTAITSPLMLRYGLFGRRN